MPNLEQQWQEAQAWERNWWLNAREQHPVEIGKGDFVGQMMFIDPAKVKNKRVIDIGCGPLSLLLRIPTAAGSAALDPLEFADLEAEYTRKGITRLIKSAEDLNPGDGRYDEAWIYNCLQHVKDPERILQNAMSVAEVVRIFEWTYIKPYTGHLHELTPAMLSAPFISIPYQWHTAMSTTGWLNHSGLNGNFFTGIFTSRPIDL